MNILGPGGYQPPRKPVSPKKPANPKQPDNPKKYYRNGEEITPRIVDKYGNTGCRDLYFG